MSARYDAVAIGGNVGGLTAAAYLARAGRSVLLLEAGESLGGSCRASSAIAGARAPLGRHTLDALDPRIVRELGLVRRGLKFALRDMALVRLAQDGKHLVLGRDVHAAARAIAAHCPADGDAYRRYRAQLFALARALRPWWWEARDCRRAPRSESQRRLLARLEVASAASFLNGCFESEPLKAMLAFDAGSPFEPGSALTPVWRAAQEMCGLQGAVAVPLGGPAALVSLLVSAAQEAGVEIRTRARVGRLILAENSIAGVELESGEKIFARAVLSGLSRRRTLLGLAPTAGAGLAETQALLRAAPRVGEASILLALNAAPAFGGSAVPATARFIVAERLEAYAGVAAARAGRLPDELVLEVVVPTAAEPALAPPGQHIVSVRVLGLPVAPDGGWAAMSAKLADRVVSMLERHTTHLRERIVAMDLRHPGADPRCDDGCSGTRIVASFASRIATPIEGLFLCGAAAEPVDAISGRAGRLAAQMAAAWLGRETAP